MSRLELNAIQAKLKAAIQNHQMLVVKMKGDNQNSTLKKGLADLQEEIKKLSEEQKKIVVKLRESLVKSSSQPQPTPTPATPIVTVGQTITAIGQPRLVSFPTQGGATILPVGMVAVPIAHMQRPAVGMAIHPAGATQMSQATNLSLIPAGIISSGCNISLSNINSGTAIGINNSVGSLLQGSIAISSSVNTFNGSNGAALNSSTTTTPSTGISVSDSSVHSNTGNGSININPNNNNCIISPVASSAGDLISNSSIALSNLTNMTNLVLSNNINNHILSNSSTSSSNCLANGTSTASVAPTFSTNNQPATTTPTSSTPGVLISPFPQQPLVQPQLLQQQQQQILQMIQAQQQQQPPPLPQQRLASHLPIKVPQYTASLIRPNASTIKYCNIAPAQSMTVTAPVVRPTSSTVSSSANSLSISKPIISKENGITGKELHKAEISKPQQPKQQNKPPQKKLLQQQHQQQQVPPQSPVKQLSQAEVEKIQFMEVLDLYTDDALKELVSRKSERKRRTTANPNYSFGFDLSRRDRNGSIWTGVPTKKARTGRGRGSNNWSDSTSIQDQQKPYKSNDNHDDYCAACGKGGQLLMCETCRLVYHLDCLNPPLTEAPKYAWSCPKCLVSGKGLAHLNSEALAKVHTYIAKKAVKEDDRKKAQRKGREINTEKSFLDNRSKELEKKMKEQVELQTKLNNEEQKVKDDLSKLSNFVRVMRESRTAEHLTGTTTS